MDALCFIRLTRFLRLQSGKADLYLRGEPDYLHEDWLAKSVPIQMESVIEITALIAFNGSTIYPSCENRWSLRISSRTRRESPISIC